jgi:hypothetical protein
MGLQLSDAQSCIAREYGFASWPQLKAFVDAQASSIADAGSQLRQWRLWTFGAGYQSSKPELAARLLRDHPALLEGKPCAGMRSGRCRQRAEKDRQRCGMGARTQFGHDDVANALRLLLRTDPAA